MAQHDYVIANDAAANVRSDINIALQAIASNNSGASAPSTTYANQWWYDTSTNTLKIRSEANDAWISFATFDQATDTWSVTSLKATTEIRTPAILDASGGTTATVNGIPLRPGVLDPENRIINGAFDFWQRGTSFTASAYGADRWQNANNGGTVTMSRQAFALGDTLGNNSPTYFLRQAVSGQSASGHLAVVQQRVEGVRSYAGQTITVLGWARRSSGSGNMAIDAEQFFGSGGSPSSRVTAISPTTITLTGSWAPFAAVLTIPSITGKTLGTNGNDYLQIDFWTSAGSTYNASTNSLGLQTIGVDLWGIHIKQGTHTTSAVDLYRQPELGPELLRCWRYAINYRSAEANGAYYRYGFGECITSTQINLNIVFPVPMRAVPSLTTTGTAANYAVYSRTSVVPLSAVPALGSDGSSPYWATMLGNTAGSLTQGSAGALVSNNNQTSYLLFTAEM